MRLIDTVSFEVQDFPGTDTPKYAILSHRWEKDEITFQQLRDKLDEHKDGWAKVRRFCRFASRAGYQYVWVDTCCINKESSADLSEAINSMFKYYENAHVCYAYLSDVRDEDLSDRLTRDHALRASQWFTRGWTLQELLAPRDVIFISRTWTEKIGSKDSLSSIIHQITGISEHQVRHFYGATTVRPGYVNASSVAEIMSWASKRKTTKEEDMAYSLMGLFGINMPLLYGEGKNAFTRLQLEILRISDDETIFAHHDYSRYGLLSGSVSSFEHAIGIGFTPSPWDPDRPEYAMTNKGLRIEPLLRLDKSASDANSHRYLMPLNCRVDGMANTRVVLSLSHYLSDGALRGGKVSKSNMELLDEGDARLDKSHFIRVVVYVSPDSEYWT